eukprot:1331912-Amorphochlora_amoeboformis.AAC.2
MPRGQWGGPHLPTFSEAKIKQIYHFFGPLHPSGSPTKMSAIGRAARRATGCAQRARCSISTRSMLKGHDNPPVFDTKVGYSSTVVGSLCAGIFLGGCATVKFAVWWAQKKAGKV